MSQSSNHSFIAKSLAWSVHAFTASGIISGFMAIVAISNHDFKAAMLWLIFCLFIDGVDGTFARIFKVKEVLPNFNGSSVDYVIDFATYAIIPAYFIYEADLLPDNEIVKIIAISCILLASSYYYGKVSYVTDDMYFEGFPVVWNIVAFYMFFVFDLNPWAYFVWVIILSILHFVPWKYPYPSRATEFKFISIAFTVFSLIAMIAILVLYPTQYFYLSVVGFAGLAYLTFIVLYTTYFHKNK